MKSNVSISSSYVTAVQPRKEGGPCEAALEKG